ncbi:MAG: tetratricopeptide repeat protein [Gammaproteobacteria bacterium]
MIFKTITQKLIIVIITALIASCSFQSDVTEKIQHDIVEFKESTINISSPNLRFRRYRLMAKKGNSEAMVELASSYLYEENIRPFNEKKAMGWLTKSAAIGNPHASSELAEIYSEGLYDGEGNVRIKSNIETSLMWSYIAKEQSKNIPGKNIMLLNSDHKSSMRTEKSTQRAKQRAEEWLAENNT